LIYQLKSEEKVFI